MISVGNITVGGTGKTPLVMWLAGKFVAEGVRVAILSRGYRGKDGTSDEIALMKRRLDQKVRFGVGADRYTEGKRLEDAEPVDLFLLDDGFQHLRLAREVDILLLNTGDSLKKGWLLPAGRLREPWSSKARADIIVLRRDGDAGEPRAQKSKCFGGGTRMLGFRKLGAPGPLISPHEFRPGLLVPFCGIGKPLEFFESLRRFGLDARGGKTFRDHHHYSQSDVDSLESAALAEGAAGLVTTEKDEQNLCRSQFRRLPVFVCVVEFQSADEAEFLDEIRRLIAERRGKPL